jgi:hypothetical protein
MFGSAEKKLSIPLKQRGLLLARGCGTVSAISAEANRSDLCLRGSGAEKLALYESAEQVADKESALQQPWQ